jgi:hypothetical protein
MVPNTTNADKEEGSKPLPSSQFWTLQLSMAKKDHEEFWSYGKKVETRFKNAKDSGQKHGRGKRFNILYSNTETLKAALYARTAKPDVRQRFTQKKDALARTAGEMMERVLSYCSDTTHHDRSFRQGVHDMVLPGRGVVWLEYEPQIGTDEMGQEIVADQKVDDSFVYYRDFLHSPSRCWAEVWWIARRKLMTRDDMRDAGFKDADSIPLNWLPELEGGKEKEVPDALKRAEVWEIWHKSKKERIFVVEGHPKVARVDADPYGLSGFWPCAEPAQAITSNDSFVPSALFCEYEDQADDLDEITERISKLTRALKRRGIYDASIKELRRLSKAADNEFIPAENFAAFASSGGLKVAFQTEDLKPIADALLGLYEQKNQLVQQIYEIMGMGDIMRGVSDPNETLGAQQLKAQFGSTRIKTMQSDVQRWIRDTLRIKAELIAEHFEPQTLLAMSGMDLETEAERKAEEAKEQAEEAQKWQMEVQQAVAQGQQPPPPPEPEEEDNEEEEPTIDAVVELLRDDKMRSYQIDVETDSTIFEDAESEKASRTELLTAMAGFMQQWLPVVQVGGAPMTRLGFEMLEFGVRGFKSGRQLEEALDECKEALLEEQDNPQPPPPDPAVEREKLKMEGDAKRLEADMQLKGMDMQLKQMDLQTKGAEIELKKQSMAMDQEAKAAELGFKRQQMELDLTGKQIAMEYDSRARESDFEGKRRMMELDYAGKSVESERKAKEKEQSDKDKSESKAKAEQPKRVKFERDENGKIIGGTVS